VKWLTIEFYPQHVAYVLELDAWLREHRVHIR